MAISVFVENEEIEGLNVVASGTTPQDLSAASKVKNGLHNVKVCECGIHLLYTYKIQSL